MGLDFIALILHETIKGVESNGIKIFNVHSFPKETLPWVPQGTIFDSLLLYNFFDIFFMIN